MKKIVALLLLTSTLSLSCALPEELRNECIKFQAAQAARAYLEFTQKQNNIKGEIEIPVTVFLTLVKRRAAEALSISPLTPKENRSASAPSFEIRPSFLMRHLAHIVAVLHTFNDEPDKASVAEQFYKEVESHLTRTAIRPSTPAGYLRPLTPLLQIQE